MFVADEVAICNWTVTASPVAMLTAVEYTPTGLTVKAVPAAPTDVFVPTHETLPPAPIASTYNNRSAFQFRPVAAPVCDKPTTTTPETTTELTNTLSWKVPEVAWQSKVPASLRWRTVFAAVNAPTGSTSGDHTVVGPVALGPTATGEFSSLTATVPVTPVLPPSS